ncbi:MAG: cell division protein SepF [Lachnospiraceae bacterium]|nr:cell division protein SepF [Lachnospiraceae bacterium]
MGAFDKIVDILRIDPDDDYEDDDIIEEKPQPSVKNEDAGIEERQIKKPVRPLNQSRNSRKGAGNTNMEVVRIEPTSVEDGRKISDLLLENKVVFLDLEGIDMNLAQRIIDFTSGATYAIDGTLQQMSKYTFVIAPAVVNVSGDFQESVIGNGSVTF